MTNLESSSTSWRKSTASAQGNCVEVSFAGVTRLTTAFLNAAIGQAYGEFSADEIREYLRVSGLDQQDLSLMQKVVDRAITFFANQKRA